MLKKFFNWILKLFKRDTYGITPAFLERLKPHQKDPSRKKNFESTKDVPKLVIPRIQKPCKHCGDPMFVSVGQIVYTHRACRTDYRRSLRSRYA